MIPFGSSSSLMPRMSGNEVAVLALEVRELAVADPVLAGARAAARERVLDDRRVQRLRLRDRRGVVGIEQERDVEVAVADVADDAAAQPGLVERAARLLDRGRELRHRNRDVGRHRREPGASASDAINALWRALHICARAVGSLSDSKAVAPSSSASSRVVSRSPATPASLPPNSTKRYGDTRERRSAERVQRRDRRRVEQLAAAARGRRRR